MGWNHKLARELRRRDNPTGPAWFRGEVLSPVRTEDEEGRVTYEGPLIISCYDGDVMLREEALWSLAGTVTAAGYERLYQGLSVALTGNLFSGTAGSLQILILGVIQHAL